MPFSLQESISVDLPLQAPSSQILPSISPSVMSNANLSHLMTQGQDVRQLGDVKPGTTSPVAKPKKRSARKPRKNSSSKAKGGGVQRTVSSEGSPSWGGVTSQASPFSPLYLSQAAEATEAKKPRKKGAQSCPVVRMTLGDMHQRPQVTYKDDLVSPLCGARVNNAFPNDVAPPSVGTSGAQSIRLNLLLEQQQCHRDSTSEVGGVFERFLV